MSLPADVMWFYVMDQTRRTYLGDLFIYLLSVTGLISFSHIFNVASELFKSTKRGLLRMPTMYSGIYPREVHKDKHIP